MSTLLSRALGAALLLSVPALQACDGCSGDKNADLASKKAKKKKGKRKGKNKKKKRKQTQHAGSSPRSGAAVAVQLGDTVSLWTEGRTGVMGRNADGLFWSSEGFEWEANGGRRVLAPGGALYYRFSELPDAKPMSEFLAAPQPAPEGYDVKVAAGGGGKYRLTIEAPGGRSFRLPPAKEAPKATTWFQASLPEGVRPTPKLASGVRWPRDADGVVTNGVPSGLEKAEVSAVKQESLDAWLPNLQKLTAADAKVAWSTALDLDSDKKDESVVCMDKAKDSYSCFVVEEFEAGAHYHPVGLPFTGGAAEAAPIAVKEGAFRYLVWAGPPSRSKEGAPFTGHALFYDGGAFTVDLIR